jgi:hypothetical protein
MLPITAAGSRCSAGTCQWLLCLCGLHALRRTGQPGMQAVCGHTGCRESVQQSARHEQVCAGAAAGSPAAMVPALLGASLAGATSARSSAVHHGSSQSAQASGWGPRHPALVHSAAAFMREIPGRNSRGRLSTRHDPPSPSTWCHQHMAGAARPVAQCCGASQARRITSARLLAPTATVLTWVHHDEHGDLGGAAAWRQHHAGSPCRQRHLAAACREASVGVLVHCGRRLLGLAAGQGCASGQGAVLPCLRRPQLQASSGRAAVDWLNVELLGSLLVAHIAGRQGGLAAGGDCYGAARCHDEGSLAAVKVAGKRCRAAVETRVDQAGRVGAAGAGWAMMQGSMHDDVPGVVMGRAYCASASSS